MSIEELKAEMIKKDKEIVKTIGLLNDQIKFLNDRLASIEKKLNKKSRQGSN